MDVKILNFGELIRKVNDEFLFVPLPSDQKDSSLLSLSIKSYEEEENRIRNISFPYSTISLNLPNSEFLCMWQENSNWTLHLIDTNAFTVKRKLMLLKEFHCLPPVYHEKCVYFITSSSKNYKLMIIWQLNLVDNRWRKLNEFQGSWAIDSFVFFRQSLLIFGLKNMALIKYDIIANSWSELPFNLIINAVIAFEKSGAILESAENNEYEWKKIGNLGLKIENQKFFLKPLSQSYRDNSIFFAYLNSENENLEREPFYYKFNLENKEFEAVHVKKQYSCNLF